MVKFLRHRELVEIPEFCHEWHDKTDVSAGWYVPCNKDGSITTRGNQNLVDNVNLYTQLMTGEYCGRKYEYDGVIDRSHSYMASAAIECEKCGEPVFLDMSMTNPCKCGADYNSFGQRLAPRSQWGEETGESWYDVPNEPLY